MVAPIIESPDVSISKLIVSIFREMRMSMKTEIKASWHRSHDFGVSQERLQAIVGSLDQLQNSDENRRLQKYASSYLRSLYHSVNDASFLICLVDSDGWVLDLFGDSQIRRMVEPMLFVPGANWAEQVMGCSGIGMSLATTRPTQVVASEHYLRICRGLSCAAAPIVDSQDRLLGAINITTAARDYHPFMLGTVVAAAGAIRADLQKPAMWAGADLFSVSGTERHTHTGSSPSQLYVANSSQRVLLRGSGQHESAPLYERLSQVPQQPHEQPLLKKPKAAHQQPFSATYQFSDIVGESDTIQEVIARAKRIAATEDNVLVVGKSGCGKELFVHAIHNSSSRAHHNFVALGAATIPRALTASELFGYVGGAFSGARRGGACGKIEMANGGTFFLDEVGDLPMGQQTALLRVLEERQITRIGAKHARPVDIRVIATTRDNLVLKAQQGKFRDDLLYRLSSLVLRIPPLCDHKEDIPKLAQHFACELAPERDIRFEPSAMKQLIAYHWPGNVRELKNVINQALFECKDELIKTAHLGTLNKDSFSVAEDLSLQRMEAELIQKALLASQGDMTEAAKKLGISVSTLYRRRHQH